MQIMRHTWNCIKTGMLIFGFGSALLAFPKGLIPLRLVVFEEYAPITGTALAILGGTLIILGLTFFFLLSFSKASGLISQKLADRFFYEFDDFPIEPSQIGSVYEFASRVVGQGPVEEHLASIKAIERRVRIQPRALIGIYRKSKSTEKLVGYYSAYPLKKQATDRIRKNQIRNALQLSEDDVCKNFFQAHSLYIGALVGDSRHAKAFAIYLVKKLIDNNLAKGRHFKQIFAKPGTPAGKRLLKEFGFTPIGDESEIWQLAADSNLRSRLRRSKITR